MEVIGISGDLPQARHREVFLDHVQLGGFWVGVLFSPSARISGAQVKPTEQFVWPFEMGNP